MIGVDGEGNELFWRPELDDVIIHIVANLRGCARFLKPHKLGERS